MFCLLEMTLSHIEKLHNSCSFFFSIQNCHWLFYKIQQICTSYCKMNVVLPIYYFVLSYQNDTFMERKLNSESVVFGYIICVSNHFCNKFALVFAIHAIHFHHMIPGSVPESRSDVPAGGFWDGPRFLPPWSQIETRTAGVQARNTEGTGSHKQQYWQ